MYQYSLKLILIRNLNLGQYYYSLAVHTFMHDSSPVLLFNFDRMNIRVNYGE